MLRKACCTVRNKRLAEREGFEPPRRLPVCRMSSAVRSTTLPPLRQRMTGTGSPRVATLIYPRRGRRTRAGMAGPGASLQRFLQLDQHLELVGGERGGQKLVGHRVRHGGVEAGDLVLVGVVLRD